MLSTFGQAISLAYGDPSATDGSNYDPSAGTTTGDTATTVATTGALLPLDKSRKIDGTNIVASDETLLISALTSSGAAYTKPPVGTVVTLASGAKRKIVAIDELNPAGTAILFDCVVRGYQ